MVCISLRRACLVALITGVTVAAVAQDVPSTTTLFDMDLDQLLTMKVTTATKRSQSIVEAPSNITIVTQRQIREWGVRDLKDLLRRVTGTPVIPDRDEWVFAFRGNVSDNNQKYLLLIDGHRVNSIENFGPGQIIEMPNNLSMVSRVEIIRGPGSAVWGADALAGVVNIITKSPAELDSHTAVVSVTPGLGFDDRSQDNTLRGSGALDFQLGRRVSDNAEFMLMGAAGYSEGERVMQSKSSGFPKNLLTPDHKIAVPGGQAGDSALVPGTYITSMDKHRFGYMLQAKGRVDAITVNAMAFSTETYNRHFEYGSGRENYLTTYKMFVEGGYTKSIGRGGQLNAKLSSDLNRAEYEPGEMDDTVVARTVNIEWLDRGARASVDFAQTIGSVANITAGIDYAYTKAGPNHRLDNFSTNLTADSAKKDPLIAGYWFDPQVEDHQVGGYLQGDVRPLKFVALAGGLRFDYNNQRGSDPFNVNPRIALLGFLGENTTLKAMYNRGYLRPANFQSAYVKKLVESETMDQVDLIWLQRIGPLSLSLNGYWQRLEGFISLLPGNAYNFRNVGDYQSLGVELEFNAAIASHELWGNVYLSRATASDFDTLLAYNSRRVDLDGKLLSYPPYGANLGFTARMLDKKVWVSPHVRLAGPVTYRTASVNADSIDNKSLYGETDPMVYLNLGVGWDFASRVGVSLYLDNILNQTDPIPLTVWNGTVEQTGFELAGKLTIRL